MFGFDPAGPQPTGDDHRARIDQADREPMQRALEHAIADHEPLSEQYRYLHPDGSTRLIHIRAEVVYEGAEAVRLIGTCQDVTERERVQNEALRRAEMQRVVARLGELALAATDLDPLFGEAVVTVSAALTVEMVAVSEWIPGEDQFVILAEAGMDDAVGARYPAGHGSQSGFTLLAGRPIVVDDWDAEDRFGRPEIVVRLGASSSVSVIVQRRDGPVRGPRRC